MKKRVSVSLRLKRRKYCFLFAIPTIFRSVQRELQSPDLTRYRSDGRWDRLLSWLFALTDISDIGTGVGVEIGGGRESCPPPILFTLSTFPLKVALPMSNVITPGKVGLCLAWYQYSQYSRLRWRTWNSLGCATLLQFCALWSSLPDAIMPSTLRCWYLV